MRLIKNTSIARHFIAVAVLSVVLNVLSLSQSRAGDGADRQIIKDPVISSMMWEGGEDDLLNDLEKNTNCVINCVQNSNCPGNCPRNCLINCLTV